MTGVPIEVALVNDAGVAEYLNTAAERSNHEKK
jgi:hypothetical protein